MSKSITDKDQQLSYLKERLQMFLEVLESIDPETTSLEDIDRLIQMITDVEEKIELFNNRDKLSEQ
ncbi:MAG TPA: SE1561 family protein [Ureibacillus sp.]|nr:SE1561 family protein [Ureibacillus sp.]